VGQFRQKQFTNYLLKDYQKMALSSHFKSKSANQKEFLRSSLNTFGVKERTEHLIEPKVNT
jgi:hypothetical protein